MRHSMSRTEKITNLGAVILPSSRPWSPIPLLWNRLVSVDDLV